MYILSFVCTGFIFSFRRSVPSILSFLLIQIFFWDPDPATSSLASVPNVSTQRTTEPRETDHLLLFITRKYAIVNLRKTATNSAKLRPIARKYEHLRVNQIQLRFFHLNQHSVILLGIHVGHWAYKREKYTFINVNIKVVNTILKVNRDNWHTFKCKHCSLKFLWNCLQFNSIPGQDG